MNVTSVVVEIQCGMSGAVLHSLALIEKASVYGFKDDKIVVVLESASPDELEKLTAELQAVEYVTGVSPVFSAHE
ncbi:MAG TPA: chaperone NapD [Dissulfurispiraceae bacterium]|nr:chaperone NapD [Dissulfurispiraceae bacterium]